MTRLPGMTADRYQNCLEMREDLENIEQLNSDYRKKWRESIYLASCLLLSLVFLSLFLLATTVFTRKERITFDNFSDRSSL